MLEGFPREIERIDRDAVAAQAWAGIEGHIPKRLGGRRLDHLPDVDSHRGVDHLEFVDERDIHRPKDIFHELGRFGGAAARHWYDLADDPAIDLCSTLPTGIGQASEHLGDFPERAARIARVFPFRRVRKVEVTAGLQPAATLENRQNDLLGCPRIGRRLQDDKLAGLQVWRDRPGCVFDVRQIGNTIGCQRCRHADQDCCCVAQRREVDGRGESLV